MQTAESLRDGWPRSQTDHCISQMPPTAKSNHNHPSSSSPWNLTHPTNMKNEQYYHFTDSCQKDISWIQLQKRFDTELLLCAVNKRQALSRRPALMRRYEGECIEVEGRKTFTVWALIWHYYPGWHTMNKGLKEREKEWVSERQREMGWWTKWRLRKNFNEREKMRGRDGSQKHITAGNLLLPEAFSLRKLFEPVFQNLLISFVKLVKFSQERWILDIGGRAERVDVVFSFQHNVTQTQRCHWSEKLNKSQGGIIFPPN